MSIGRRLDKKAVIQIHNGVLLNYKENAFESVLMRWMKLELIIKSEVSQKEKHQYSILTHVSEKAMAPHSSTLAWKITWMEEPGRLQSMGSLRVGHG